MDKSMPVLGERKEVLEEILETMAAVKKQRDERGNWTDEEWKEEEGLLSICEGLECFLPTCLKNQEIEELGLGDALRRSTLSLDVIRDDIKKIIKQVNEFGFVPTPYFESRKSITGSLPEFTDTVSYVVTTLLDYYKYSKLIGLEIPDIDNIRGVIDNGINWLLDNIHDDGGYSWGKKQFSVSHTYFTYTSAVALFEYKNNTSFNIGNEIKKRIENNLNKIGKWLISTQDDGWWSEYGSDSQGEKSPLYTAYALFAMDLINMGEERLFISGLENILEFLKTRAKDLENPYYHTIKDEPWMVEIKYEDHTAPAITLQLLVNRYSKTKDRELREELLDGMYILKDILFRLRDEETKLWRKWGYRTYVNQSALDSLLTYAFSNIFEGTEEKYTFTQSQLYGAIKDMLSQEYFIQDLAKRISESLRVKLGMPPEETHVSEILKELEER